LTSGANWRTIQLFTMTRPVFRVVVQYWLAISGGLHMETVA
jgi:hypothetical protein